MINKVFMHPNGVFFNDFWTINLYFSCFLSFLDAVCDLSFWTAIFSQATDTRHTGAAGEEGRWNL